jgi:glutamine amidotransferase
MSELIKPTVAIVNFGMGNLFSVKQACFSVGLNASITSSKQDISSADAVILPGVGAFGDAINTLERLDLIETLQEAAMSSKPFMGICIGMHLLMSESSEFGSYHGLGIIKGSVVKLNFPEMPEDRLTKVPHVGWNRIHRAKDNSVNDLWKDTMLGGLQDREFMYFVHSFFVKLEDRNIALSMTNYGNLEFCSSLQYKNIFACQFHPERSGICGLHIYKNLVSLINNNAYGG